MTRIVEYLCDTACKADGADKDGTHWHAFDLATMALEEPGEYTVTLRVREVKAPKVGAKKSERAPEGWRGDRMKPYGESVAHAQHRQATRAQGGKIAPRYRRLKRKAEAAAERRAPRKRERVRARRQIAEDVSANSTKPLQEKT